MSISKTVRIIALALCAALLCSCAQMPGIEEAVQSALESASTEKVEKTEGEAAQTALPAQPFVPAPGADWRSIYTDFILESIPELMQEDDYAPRMPGVCFALADLNMDDVPELLSINWVGNAYGDSDMDVFTIDGESVVKAGSHRYYNDEYYYTDAITFSSKTPSGIHAYKNTETGAPAFLLLSSWGASVDFGQSITVFEGDVQGTLRFNFDGCLGEYLIPEEDAYIDGKNYSFFDGQERITEAQYQKGVNAIFEKYERTNSELEWLSCTEWGNYDGRFDYDFGEAVYGGNIAAQREAVMAYMDAYTSPFDKPKTDTSVPLTAPERDAIAAIACILDPLPPFEDPAQLSKGDFMSVLYVHLWYMWDLPKTGVELEGEFMEDTYEFAVTAENADRAIYDIFGVHIPDAEVDLYLDTYPVRCEDGVYYIEMGDYNIEAEVLDHEVAGDICTVSAVTIYSEDVPNDEARAEAVAKPNVVLKLRRSDTPLGFTVMQKIK